LTHFKPHDVVACLLLLLSPAAFADGPMLSGSGLAVFAAIIFVIGTLLGYLGGFLDLQRWTTMLFSCFSLSTAFLILVSDLLNSSLSLTIVAGSAAAIPATVGSFLGHLLGYPKKPTDSRSA
jgi:hypothetical protein